MPKRIDNIIKIKFPSDIKFQYDEFEKEQVLELIDRVGDDKSILAVNAAALSVPIGGLYRDTANPSSIYIRTA